jgi:hypothetical protein
MFNVVPPKHRLVPYSASNLGRYYSSCVEEDSKLCPASTPCLAFDARCLTSIILIININVSYTKAASEGSRHWLAETKNYNSDVPFPSAA